MFLNCFSSFHFNDSQINLLKSVQLSHIQNFTLENIKENVLKSTSSTSEIPPGLVISSPLTDLENWSRLLFPRTVYCSAQYSEAVPLPHSTTSDSLWTQSPGNLWTRKHNRTTLTYCRFAFVGSRCQNAAVSSEAKHENYASGSALGTSHIQLICKPDPALWILRDATVLVIL